jgi:hypothetical protein
VTPRQCQRAKIIGSCSSSSQNTTVVNESFVSRSEKAAAAAAPQTPGFDPEHAQLWREVLRALVPVLAGVRDDL